MSLKKIEKQSIADQVFSSLKQEILNRNFEVGGKLPSEAILSKQFGVSKATVKIALQRLATLGLIETLVGQGSFVKAFDTAQYLSQMREFLPSDHDIDQITEYRLYVEMTTTKLAIKRAADENFRRMEELLRRMDDAVEKNDIVLHGKLDYEFHLEICRATGNNVFVLTYEIIGEMLRRHATVLNDEFFRRIKKQKPGNDIHWKLLQAIKEQNLDACRACYIEMFSVFKKLSAEEYGDS
ncbi:MAG: FCD domain-containing protein [Treponema sp.]|nr:FCD domain-containing protein [Treponema sp.]